MPKKEQPLYISDSLIPGAGLGLFTQFAIAKGTRIVEYTGRIITWKEALATKKFNGYVFYVTSKHVIDARPYKKALARYANDASGMARTKGLKNNATYVEDKKRVFIEAIKDIPAGAEILIAYGKEYWEIAKQNNS